MKIETLILEYGEREFTYFTKSNMRHSRHAIYLIYAIVESIWCMSYAHQLSLIVVDIHHIFTWTTPTKRVEITW